MPQNSPNRGCVLFEFDFELELELQFSVNVAHLFPQTKKPNPRRKLGADWAFFKKPACRQARQRCEYSFLSDNALFLFPLEHISRPYAERKTVAFGKNHRFSIARKIYCWVTIKVFIIHHIACHRGNSVYQPAGKNGPHPFGNHAFYVQAKLGSNPAPNRMRRRIDKVVPLVLNPFFCSFDLLPNFY